jgi:hypothetical protein
VRRWQLIAALPLLLIAGACPPILAPATDADVWFVEVEREGGYWLGPDILRKLDIDPLGKAPPPVRLSWSHQKVPHLPLRTKKGWGVFFFAADRSTRYTRRTAIRLGVGFEGERMVSEEPSSASPSPETGLATLHWEEDQRYLPQTDAQIPWVWERINTPGSISHAIELPDALPGTVSVTLDVWSHTSSAADPDHLLWLKWDGEIVGEWKWDGQGMQHLTASWYETSPEGTHTLDIEAPALPDVQVATVWVDGWEITVPQRTSANGGVWQATGAALHIESTNEESRMLDVTDPLLPQDLGLIPSDGIVGTIPGHRYWIGNPTQALEPPAVRPTRKIDVDSLTGVTYLAVAPLQFHAPLQPLLDHHRNQGLTADVVDVNAVYDTFGNGLPDPEAIRLLVQRLPDLRYLLLVGDGTAEPGGYDGQDGALRVVVPLVRTTMLGETPADVLLGADQEGQPTVAVGRFPATSTREVQAMVDKTLRWESGPSLPAALIVSDDEPEFASVSRDIADALPEGMPLRQVDAGDEQSRAEALETLREGPTWVNYTGHGSLTLLCDEGTLRLEDGESWDDPAVMVAWTCLAGHFIHPKQDSIGEAWMRIPRGGVAAFLGPVGETTTGEQVPYARVFYTNLREEGRLGDAWLAALQQGSSQDVVWGYTILGDPALRVYQK